VPDAEDAITSNAGWDTIRHKDFLTEVCKEFRSKGIRTSIFIGADPRMAEAAAICGCDRIELYTEPYAEMFPKDPEAAVAPFIKAAQMAAECGLEVNAGHDLNLDNLEFFIRNIPWTDEVSIGHAIISDALYMGLEATIKAYLSKIKIF
jgi:pyridoxine 5-phosphate synthase